MTAITHGWFICITLLQPSEPAPLVSKKPVNRAPVSLRSDNPDKTIDDVLKRVGKQATVIDGSGSQSLSYADMSNLRIMPSVQVLDLGGTNVEDRDLIHIANLPRLECLFLGGTRVTDRGLRKLSHLPRLKHLSLAGAKITGEGLSGLATSVGLVDCDLSYSNVNDVGIQTIAQFTKLETLTEDRGRNDSCER